MRSKSLVFVFVCLAISLFGGTAFAQVFYGSIVGDVTDPSGAAVPNVTVTITHAATAQTRSGVTDSGGRYAFSDLQDGTYALKFAAKGFRPVEETGVRVTANTVSRSDVTLQIGSVSEQVTVEASAALLQTDKADVHTELSAQT